MPQRLASRDEIRIRMIQRRTSHLQIALHAGVTREAITRTIAGHTKNPVLRAAVTSALGWPASRLWADAGARRKKGRAA